MYNIEKLGMDTWLGMNLSIQQLVDGERNILYLSRRRFS
jgi:hypothetical protein